MKERQLLATVALVLWLALVTVAFGPARWGAGHGYELVIKGVEDSLPRLTSLISLPVLGIGPSSFTATLVFNAFWAFAWLPPVVLLAGVWRASKQEDLLELLVYGGGIYLAGLALASFLVVVGLWLPVLPVF